MRGVRGGVAAALAAGLLLTGCAAQAAPTDLPVFPAPGVASAAAGAPTDVGVVPDDCTRVLGPADLGAVLGLPLNSVTVRTVVGMAAPSVGRTERLDCFY